MNYLFMSNGMSSIAESMNLFTELIISRYLFKLLDKTLIIDKSTIDALIYLDSNMVLDIRVCVGSKERLYNTF